MTRRALVSQTRMPAFDQDCGSQIVDDEIRYLLDDGWSVTFLAKESDVDEYHAHRLRQMGVATFAGYNQAPEIVANGNFDLAVLSFWNPAAKLMAIIREHSPTTRVIVHSIDLHFLRDARLNLGLNGRLDTRLGTRMINELNTYHEADATLTVSDEEANLVRHLLGPGRTHVLPLADAVEPSSAGPEDREGMFFVGNFRHLPNGEAVEYLCREVLPLVDEGLRSQHHFVVAGNCLDDKVRAHGEGLDHIDMVGWVPSVVPYLHRARITVVPLLHGAGVKGKVIQSLMAGTPVVTTPIGAEGLDLVDGEHALIAESPTALAQAITQLLTDDDLWARLVEAGAEHVTRRHGPEAVGQRFRAIVDEVMARPARGDSSDPRFERGREREDAYDTTRHRLRTVAETITEPGSDLLIVSRGDDDLLDVTGRTGRHFPQGRDGGWAGYHPVDSDAALSHLDALQTRGARYLVVPGTAFWWLDHYDELARHLATNHRRIHADDHVIVFDLAKRSPALATGEADPNHRPRVLVLGRHRGAHGEPPAALIDEFESSRRFAVTQSWESGDAPHDEQMVGYDWIVTVDDRAVLPSCFLDDSLAIVEASGADRAQPAHQAGPDGGPPLTERLLGCVGREVKSLTVLPVTFLRNGASTDSPVLLVDAVPIGLTEPLDWGPGREPDAVIDVLLHEGSEIGRGVRRSTSPRGPRLSVLLSTFERPTLLAQALEGFCTQTLDANDFEVVVVDDGSDDDETLEVLAGFEERLPLTWVRIDHAGRSAAKNLAVQLARGDVVLFFDDDDRAEPRLLEEHLRGHGAHPAEGTAVLGHTTWAPELDLTALMHYLTDVDEMLFSYGKLTDGQTLNWRGFWEGRVSCRRSLLMDHGLHDQRLAYSIDVEMAYRLQPHGLRVVYHAAARSVMARPIGFEDFCRRVEAKGRAQALIASLHDHEEVRRAMSIEGAVDRWREAAPTLDAEQDAVRTLEARIVEDGSGRDDDRLAELHRGYRQVFRALEARGIASATGEVDLDAAADATVPTGRASTVPAAVLSSGVRPVQATESTSAAPGDETPALTVTIPVWSRTAELADMATETIGRIWEVARLPTEVVVVDNGSPHERPLRARVHRFEENRGVSVGWNAGLGLARASVAVVLNSDCLVEPGWDEALHEAASSGRRIAFPYTDHGDGLGFRQPDQGGTSGWCFALSLDLYREIGPFDERFSPAFCEDTDYWHRAWELGVELSPVPAARVTHARRATSGGDAHSERLLQAHRYKYGWKHGVDPDRAPPYYNREIVDYECLHVAGVTP